MKNTSPTIEAALTRSQFRAPKNWNEGYDVILEIVDGRQVFFQIHKTDNGFRVERIKNDE